MPGRLTRHSEDEPAWPRQQDFGAVGAFYLGREPDWIRRHVETVRIGPELRRQITVDVELPTDPEAIVAYTGEQALFCIPITQVQKDPPVTSVDLRAEDGRTLPLITRQESSEISELALLTAISHALGAAPSDKMAHGIELLIYEDDDLARFGQALFDIAFEEDAPRLADVPNADRFARVAVELASNFYLWLPLLGLPGERRVIKFSWRLPSSTPRTVARIARYEQVEWHLDGDVVHLSSVTPGRVLIGRSWDLRLARMSGSVGWDAIDVRIDYPALRDCDSYHLQLFAPAGGEVVKVGTEHQLLTPDGEEVIAETRCDGDAGHFYVPGLQPARPESIVVAIRVAREGFLNLCVVLALLIATLLWAFQASAATLQAETPSQVAAAVLLVVPAILIVVVVRPAGESALASSLLAGVRALMVAAGLLAVAAGAALAGARPFSHLSEAFIWYATAASVIAAALCVAWLAAGAGGRRMLAGSLHVLRTAPAGPAWTLASTIGTLAAVAALADALLKEGTWQADHPVEMGILLLLCGFLLWALSQLGRRGVDGGMPAPARMVTWALAFVVCALGVRLLGADPAHLALQDVARPMPIVSLVGAVVVAWACLWVPPSPAPEVYNG